MPNPYLDLPDDEPGNSNPYLDLPDDNKIEPHENILQKAMKATSQVGQEFLDQGNQFGYGFTDEATLGAPSVAKKFGLNMDPGEPKNIMQGVARGAGRVGGFAYGLPEHIAASAVKGIGNPLIRGMAKGGVSMASLSPAGLASGESDLPTEGKRIGIGTLTGGVFGAGEAVGDKANKYFFRKNIAKAQIDSLNKELQVIKDKIRSDPNSSADATDLWVKLSDVYDNLAPEVQRQVPKLKRWIDDIAGMGGKVKGDFVRQMESDFGASAKFTSQKNGFFQFLRKPTSPEANKAYQQSRTVASGTYDDLATKVGHPEYASKSSEMAAHLKKFPDMDPSKPSSGGLLDALIALGTGMSAPPGLKAISGIGTYLAEKAVRSPGLRQKAFEMSSNPSVMSAFSTAGKLGGATAIESARSLAKKRQ